MPSMPNSVSNKDAHSTTEIWLDVYLDSKQSTCAI